MQVRGLIRAARFEYPQLAGESAPDTAPRTRTCAAAFAYLAPPELLIPTGSAEHAREFKCGDATGIEEQLEDLVSSSWSWLPAFLRVHTANLPRAQRADNITCAWLRHARQCPVRWQWIEFAFVAHNLITRDQRARY